MTHLPGRPMVPRTIMRFGTSVGLSEFSFGADDGIPEVAEELIVVVEIAGAVRADVRHRQSRCSLAR